MPFDASPNWNMQGAPGMAEKPGIPHEEWCWLDFFLPSLSWNKHSAGRTRILLLHTARAGVPYRHHLLSKNQPETPAAVGQCLQLPQATLLPGHHIFQGCWGRKEEPCRCWGAKKPQHLHCGAAPPPPRAARGSVCLSWSSDTPWARWRFVSSNDTSQEMNFLLLSCHCGPPSSGAMSSIETTLKYFSRDANRCPQHEIKLRSPVWHWV